MNKRKIKRRFERIFMSKVEKRHQLVGPPKLWKMKQDFQFDFLKNHGLEKSTSFLDVGCGTLRGGIPIIAFLEAGKYTGIEVREKVLLEGKKELKEHQLEHKKPALLSFDHFDTLHLETKFDIIFSFSVLIHMEDDIANASFRFVREHLSENGVYYANVNIGARRDGNWQGFPIAWRSLEFYQELSKNNGLSLNVLGRLGDLGHQSGVASQDNQVMFEIRLA